MKWSFSGQGALEYLLLIGGAVLLATIVMFILFNSAVPHANSSVQNVVNGSQQQLINNPILSPLQFPPLAPISTPSVVLGSTPNQLSFAYASNQLTLQSYLSSQPIPVSSTRIWDIRLRDASGVVIQRDAQSVNVPVQMTQATQSSVTHTQFVWGAISLSGADSMRVTVTISNASNSSDFLWKIKVDAPSGYVIDEIHFPIYEVSPLSSNPTYAVLPLFGGQLITNPFFAYSQTLRHPGALLQFVSLYDSVTKQGVYFSTLDGQGYTKEYLVNSSSSVVEWEHIFHVPRPSPSSYELPYSTVLSSLQGDWFDAARKYRSWALTNPKISGRGKWALASSVSQKIKDLDMAILQSPSVESFDSHALFADEIIAASNFFNTENMMVYWYRWHQNLFDDDWPEHAPKSTFIPAMQQVHSAKPGITITPYYFAGGWDLTLNTGPFAYTSALAPRMCQDPINVPKISYVSGTGAQYAFMDFSQQANRDFEKSVVSTLQGYGADGVYYDYFSGLTAELCQNSPASTGHPSNGGSYWSDGKRQMLLDVKQHGQLTDPNFVVTSEAVDEFLIPGLDMMNYYPTFNFDFGINHPVPVWGVVYHDYILSSSFSNGPLLYSNISQNVLELESLAFEFITGKIMNHMNWFADTQFFAVPASISPVAMAVMDYSKILQQSYSFTRPYLLHGEFMRPLSNSYFGDLQIDFLQTPHRPLSSVWRRIDSTSNHVAVVMANPRDTAALLNDSISLSDYGFSPTQVVSVYRYSTASPSPQLMGTASGTYVLNESVNPKSVLMLEFR